MLKKLRMDLFARSVFLLVGLSSGITGCKLFGAKAAPASAITAAPDKTTPDAAPSTTPTPSDTPSATPTPSYTPSPTPSPSDTPTPTPTPPIKIVYDTVSEGDYAPSTQALIHYPDSVPVFKSVAEVDGVTGAFNYPTISQDGSLAYFSSYQDLTDIGGATGGNLFKVDTASSQINLVSLDATGKPMSNVGWTIPSCDDAGDSCAFNSVYQFAEGGSGSEIALSDSTSLVTSPIQASGSSNYLWVGLAVGGGNSMSGDGANVAFSTSDGSKDLIYRKNINTNTLVKVNVTDDGTTEVPIPAPASGAFSMSKDGSKISYVSNNNPFGFGAANNWQILVKDMNSGQTVAASVTRNGAYNNGAWSVWNSMLSRDGSVVIFDSQSPALLPAGVTGQHTFAKNFNSGSLVIVDSDSDGNVFYNTPSYYGQRSLSVSDDGRFVCFTSFGPNALVGANSNHLNVVYVKDVKTNEIEVISKTTSGDLMAVGNASCAISGDGRFALFYANSSISENASTTNSYLHMRQITLSP